MGISILIKKSQTISLDSNVFIRALDDPTSLGEESRNIIARIKKIAPKSVISTIVLEEFFVKVFKQKRQKETQEIINFLTLDGLAVFVDVNKEIALLAAKIRAVYGIKAPDAFHLASAIHSGADVFITTDKKLPRKIDHLTVVILEKKID